MWCVHAGVPWRVQESVPHFQLSCLAGCIHNTRTRPRLHHHPHQCIAALYSTPDYPTLWRRAAVLNNRSATGADCSRLLHAGTLDSLAVLNVDYAAPCEGGAYNTYLVLSVAGILVFALGIPLLVLRKMQSRAPSAAQRRERDYQCLRASEALLVPQHAVRDALRDLEDHANFSFMTAGFRPQWPRPLNPSRVNCVPTVATRFIIEEILVLVGCASPPAVPFRQRCHSILDFLLG